METTLIKVITENDIPAELKETPIGQLLRYHNLSEPFSRHEKAEMLISMCMDNRKQLNIPGNFAYIIRTGGGNLRYSEFKLSYAVAIGGIRHVSVIAHNHCGMVSLMSKKDAFIEGLCRLPGWDRQRAEEHFFNYAPMFEIDNEITFAAEEAERLGKKYSGVLFVPLYYTIEDNMLSVIIA